MKKAENTQKTAKNAPKTAKNGSEALENAQKRAKTPQKRTKRAPDSLELKVEKLKDEAERKGLLDNLLFSELLDSFVYQTQLLNRLRAEIDGGDLVTEKTYVKGKPNASPNKLIATYNATSNARVNTVSAIAKLVRSINEDEDSAQDPLAKILQGG